MGKLGTFILTWLAVQSIFVGSATSDTGIKITLENDTLGTVLAQLVEQTDPSADPTNYWPAKGLTWFLKPKQKLEVMVPVRDGEYVCVAGVRLNDTSMSWGVWSTTTAPRWNYCVRGNYIVEFRFVFDGRTAKRAKGEGCNMAWGDPC